MPPPKKQNHRPKAVVLFGPTAAGKTAASLHLAQALGGEIINADSRQIYQEMPIITAMPTAEEQAAAPHHMFDFLPPDKPFSVGQWRKRATDNAQKIWEKGRTPIFVGGTGFYLKTLMEGISPMPETDAALQQELETEVATKGLEVMYAALQKFDPAWAAKITPKDHQRIVRGHLAYRQTKKTLTQWHKLPPKGALECDFVCIAISPPRDVLNGRIHNRFLQMIKDGVVDEAQKLYDKYINPPRNGQGISIAPSLTSIGLPVYADFFENKITLNEAHEAVEQQMRQYAKRQRTWLRNSYPKDALIFENGADTENIVKSVLNKLQSS